MDAAWQSVHQLRRDQPNGQTPEDFMQAVFPPVDRGHYVLLDQAAARLGELAKQLPERTVGKRLALHAAAKVADGPAAARWISDLDATFNVLVHRAARQRNAVIHGTPTIPAVIATVDRFCQQLGRIAVGGSIRAGNGGVGVVTQFEQEILEFEQFRWRLESGEVPADILREMFPPTE